MLYTLSICNMQLLYIFYKLLCSQSIMTGTSTVTAMEQTIPDISDMMATSPLVYFLTDGRQQSIPVEPGSEAASKYPIFCATIGMISMDSTSRKML